MDIRENALRLGGMASAKARALLNEFKGDSYSLSLQDVGIEPIVANVQAAIEDPKAHGPREALGLATDLGGYAIMVGATNGGHLTSFSLVDITSHGRACADGRINLCNAQADSVSNTCRHHHQQIVTFNPLFSRAHPFPAGLLKAVCDASYRVRTELRES